MSPLNVLLRDPPPDRVASRHRPRIAWAHQASIIGAALVLALALAATTQAQPPRIDPGEPPQTGGTGEGWQFLTIPGLPANGVLGDVWASPNGDVYVWAKYPQASAGMVSPADEPPDGEKLPNPPGGGPTLWSSALYRFDGMRWTTVLSTPGQVANALLGGANGEVFATTIGQMGEAHVYHFNGVSWTQEVLPDRYLGRLHTLAGVPGDMFLKIDRVILHHEGVRFVREFEMPASEAPVRGLVYLNALHLYAMCPDGHFLLDTATWTACRETTPFSVVEDAWGMREDNGQLQMYAVGSKEGENGMRVWRFKETDPVTHAGDWITVVAEPEPGWPNIGHGTHVWGGAANDVYAAGVVAGAGRMMRFDGAAWAQLVSPRPLGVVHGLSGTANGVVWFSTESGQLVRYVRPNSPPDVAAAAPSVDRLWPPDSRMVPVNIHGVVDAEGDAFTLTIDNVRQDEDAINAGTHAYCPDAMLSGGQLFLRAEHQDNGDGRTYDIQFTATDRLGATRTGHVFVCAPHFITTPCDVDVATFDSFGPCAAPIAARPSLLTELQGGALHVRFDLAEAAPIHLAVYDIMGRLRGTIEDGIQAPGTHEATWALSTLTPGLYFVKLRTPNAAFTTRVVVPH
jgi:hypothetical protein